MKTPFITLALLSTVAAFGADTPANTAPPEAAPTETAPPAPPTVAAPVAPSITPVPLPAVPSSPGALPESPGKLPPPPLAPPTVEYPDQQAAPLDDKDKAGLAIAQVWEDAPSRPAPGADGRILFTYGATLPSIVCTPMQVTDVELEPGEVVKEGGMHIGDAMRWLVAPSVSGPDNAQTTHLVIKPSTPGITTSILVATDRRVYHLKLVSSASDWMPYVAFFYPENARAAWYAYQKHQQKAHTEAVVSDSGHTVSELDFGYSIDGKAPWSPLRVYNDGLKTYIQMPLAMLQTEAPALLVIGSDDKEQLVNYRLHGDKYVVDQVFQKAELISGVGKKQLKITITRVPLVAANEALAYTLHRR